MNTEIISISKSQYLGDVLDVIPTNVILNKTITGCGATTLEIKSQRNSIIIEPNVPVIIGKSKKHPEILGVYEGVTTEKITEYLQSEVQYKKILTTPESFSKVKKAMNKLCIPMTKEYFMLFDECEKVIQDVDYRSSITLPIDTFFDFKGKAMVSATPIIPQDPRFEKQEFRLLKIEPTYDYRKEINILATNNSFATFKRVIDRFDTNEKIFVFLNSTNAIEEIISIYGLKELTNVYCSTESMEKLKREGFKNVYNNLASKDGKIELNRYNFFTSRFYSALDIELDFKPVVIMMTELFSAPYSLIDPATESVQIAGRFRNGISRLIHITNYNKRREYKKEDEIKSFLEGQHTVFMQFLKMKNASRQKGEIYILSQALKSVDYSRYVNPSGEINHFMYNNAYRDEYVKSVYKTPFTIKTAYTSSNAFNITYSFCKSRTTDNNRRMLRNDRIKKTELNKEAYNQIKKLISSKDEYDKEYLRDIKDSFNLVYEAYEVLDEKKMKELGFNETLLRRAISEKKASDKQMNEGVLKAIYLAFNEHTRYTNSDINKKLKEIYNTYDVKCDLRGVANKITLYFDAEQNNTSSSRGWKLKTRLHKMM